MKLIKKILLAIILVISILVIAPKDVNAASIKLNKTSKTIYEGNTYTLKVTGTKKKVTWSSSNKKVATVNSKGKVTAKENGKVTITAKVGKTKLTCKVKVRLVQFETTFYTLKNGSKASISCKKVKKYKNFKYDLDGDGKKDTITMKFDKKTNVGTKNYIFSLNGKKFYESDNGAPEIYITDLNKSDKTIQVITADSNGGLFTSYKVWVKKGNKMKKVSSLWGDNLRINKKGKLIIDDDEIVMYITPKVHRGYYIFNNNKIKYQKANMNNIKKTVFSIDNTDNSHPIYTYGSNGEEYITELLEYGKKVSFNILKFGIDSDDPSATSLDVKLINNKYTGYIFIAS